jgi:hypothetical protein
LHLFDSAGHSISDPGAVDSKEHIVRNQQQSFYPLMKSQKPVGAWYPVAKACHRTRAFLLTNGFGYFFLFADRNRPQLRFKAVEGRASFDLTRHVIAGAC